MEHIRICRCNIISWKSLTENDIPHTVHEISMQYFMANPNIRSNALLNFLTNDTYARGGLTLNQKPILR